MPYICLLLMKTIFHIAISAALLCLFLAAGVARLHARDIESTFISDIDFISLTLNSEQRKLLIDAYRRGDTVAPEYLNGSPVTITNLSDSARWIRLATSKYASLEIKNLQPLHASPSTVLIYTACAPACHSNIYIIRPDSAQQQSLNIPRLQPKDFLDSSSPDFSTALSLISVPLVQYSFPQGSDTLRAHLSALDELDEETLKRVNKSLSATDLFFVYDPQQNVFTPAQKP